LEAHVEGTREIRNTYNFRVRTTKTQPFETHMENNFKVRVTEM
jgi:hypothetical protein